MISSEPGYLTLSSGCCSAALDGDRGNTYPHIFWPHLNSGFFLVVFRIWRSSGSFSRTPGFKVHMLRFYQDTSRLTDSS